MLRVRHCIECPKCHTRYLPGSSPYPNGSYLVPLTASLSAGCILYCSCSRPHICSQWGWRELKPYEVSGQAHRRGFGSPEETQQIQLLVEPLGPETNFGFEALLGDDELVKRAIDKVTTNALI